MERGGSIESVAASDRRYFELAADRLELPGATLLHLPEAPGVGAATAVWVDDPGAALRSRDWPAMVRAEAEARQAPALRIYGLDAWSDGQDAGRAVDRCGLEALLADAGLSPREELAFVGGDTSLRERAEVRVELRPVEGDAGRADRRLVYKGAATAPDGYPIDPELFLRCEERRAATGEMDLFIGWADDEPVAAVGALRCGRVLRLKNLMVRTDRRRRRFAAAVAMELLAMAEAEDLTLVTVAIAGEPGEGIYRSVSMDVCGRLTEWSVDLQVGP